MELDNLYHVGTENGPTIPKELADALWRPTKIIKQARESFDPESIINLLIRSGSGAPHHPPEHRPLSKSGPRAARSRLATTGSLISPEPLIDPRWGLFWLLGIIDG